VGLACGELELDALALARRMHTRHARLHVTEPGRGRYQGRRGIGARAQLVGDALAVLHQRGHAEVDVAGRLRTGAGGLDLVDDFLRLVVLARRADAAGEQARPHVAAHRVLADPVVEQHVEGLRLLRARPVQLRREIVEPAFLQPQLGIRVQLVVLREAGNAGRTAVRTAQAERADAEADPVLFAV